MRGFQARKRVEMIRVSATRAQKEFGVKEDENKIESLRKKLGDFDYDSHKKNDSNELEFRAAFTLVNDAVYEGQWNKTDDTRQGMGK